MSKAEVERIWLPVRALDPAQLRAAARALARAGLVLQLAVALAVEHLLNTGW